MNVQEFRVGNYIKDTFDIKNIEIRKLDLEDFSVMLNFQNSNNNQNTYNPITLTEEILLKCGFTDLKDDSWGEFIDIWIDKIDFVNVLMKDKLFIGKDSKDGLYYFLVTRTGNGEYMYFESISAPMQYLHTLQNYYLTFSGTELEINL